MFFLFLFVGLLIASNPTMARLRFYLQILGLYPLLEKFVIILLFKWELVLNLKI